MLKNKIEKLFCDIESSIRENIARRVFKKIKFSAGMLKNKIEKLFRDMESSLFHTFVKS